MNHKSLLKTGYKSASSNCEPPQMGGEPRLSSSFGVITVGFPQGIWVCWPGLGKAELAVSCLSPGSQSTWTANPHTTQPLQQDPGSTDVPKPLCMQGSDVLISVYLSTKETGDIAAVRAFGLIV